MSNQTYLFNFSNKTNNKLKNINSNLTLYYFLYEQPGNISNSNEVLLTTIPSDPNIYRGITNRFMCNSSYNSYTSDILSYVSGRTPGSSDIGVFDLNMYNEILTINSIPYQDNYIQAFCNYEDKSDGFATTVAYNNFVVTAASGKFAGYKNIKITYNNTGKYTRILEFS